MGHGKIKIGEAVFTASQVANLYGCGFGTRLEMYQKFIGQPCDREPSEEAKASMEFGTFFEDAVARFFAEKKGWKIRKCGETAYWQNDMPYFICHPDRLVSGRDEQGRRVALEVKCVRPFAEGWGEDGSNIIPDHYYFQVQSYFACGVPCDVVYVVCLNGNRVNSYEILPDDDIIADIRHTVRKAHDEFEAGIVPKAENYEVARQYYSKKADLLSNAKPAGDEGRRLWKEMLMAREAKEAYASREESYKAKLIEFMGDSPALVTTEGDKVVKLASWSDSSSSSFDKARLAQDHPEIDLTQYVVKTPQRKVTFRYKETK